MKHAVILTGMLLLGQTAFAADPVDPRKAVEQNAGDTDAAVGHLGKMLRDLSREDIFADFDAGGVNIPNDSVRYAATRILAIQRMGKISVHAPEVRSAFTHEFLTARADPTRLHEALALYERFAVANPDDPYWRLIRARCARLMDLPETLELYEQVAADMTGPPPDEEIQKLWEANREEFPLDPYIKRFWVKQTTQFVSGSSVPAKGLDVPGSLTIPAKPLPLLDIAGAVGSEAADWETALDDPSNTSAKMLDHLYSEAKKFGELPWRDGRGFLNTEQVLAAQWLAQPPEALAELRTVQEQGFKKATAQGAEPAKTLHLFRRYPWSESAQRQLLRSAKQHLFNGEAQAAFRCFQDLLRHAEATDLREEAQVGLWVSLSQFAEPEVVDRAFDGVNADATWPWYGKRVKTELIKQRLVGRALLPVQAETDRSARPTEERAPSLASLRLHVVHLPPAPTGRNVCSIDMQRNGDQLLVSGESVLLMYNATRPTRPVWSQTRRLYRSSGATQVLPSFAGQQIITPFASEHRLVSLRRVDGTIGSEGNPHGPHTRYRYQTIGGPVTSDHKAYAVQFGQPYLSIYGHPEKRHWGDVALSCFGSNLTHLWTRSYERTHTIAPLKNQYCNSVLPRVSQGAVFFCTNAGHVIRADARDGEMEWMHFFRPVTGDRYRQPASPWCLGGIAVTDDRVVCMPKFTGYLFGLEKATGRRIWRTPLLRGHEMLGLHDGNIVVTSANSIYSIDVDTGKLQWGRQIAPQWVDGFQLPRSQLIGSSVYCGTKNTLHRFDVRSGALLESRNWAIGNEAPMSFLIAGADLYAISDLPMKDETFERRLEQHLTFIGGGGSRVQRKDGSVVFWSDGMLVCIKDNKLVWSRFVSNSQVDRSRLGEQNGTVSMSWSSARSGTSAVHDSATGRLLSMQRSRDPRKIMIGGK